MNSPPFFGVRATRDEVGMIDVSGQHRLDTRRGGVRLAQERPVGVSDVLDLRLRYLRNHRGANRCQSFRGLFKVPNVPPVREVRIIDWMDRRVIVSVR